MPKILTESAVKAASPPPKGTVTLWDASLKNFGLRVSQGGARTFVVLIASGRRQAIGRFPTISLSQARTEAKRILAEKTLGRVRPLAVAFDDAKKRYLNECEKRNRPRTVYDYRRLLKKHYPFGRTSLADIKPQEIVRRLAKLDDAPVEKHHAFTAGRAFFRWAVRQHYLDRSPMETLSVPAHASSRERILADEELKTAYQCASDYPYPFGPIFRLLVLTGQRRGEIGALRWDWIDEDKRTITLPASMTKNKRSHIFPYGEVAADILEQLPRQGPHLFPATREHVRGKQTTWYNGWTKHVEEFRTKCGIDHFTLHDLRRTFSSGMASLGVPQVVVEKLLNHVSGGTLSPIAQVYNRHSYMNEMIAAIDAWQKHLQRLMAPA